MTEPGEWLVSFSFKESYIFFLMRLDEINDHNDDLVGLHQSQKT